MTVPAHTALLTYSLYSGPRAAFSRLCCRGLGEWGVGWGRGRVLASLGSNDARRYMSLPCVRISGLSLQAPLNRYSERLTPSV